MLIRHLNTRPTQPAEPTPPESNSSAISNEAGNSVEGNSMECAGAGSGAGAGTQGGHTIREQPSAEHSIYASLKLLRSDPQLQRLGLLTACYYVPVYGCIATLLVYLRTTFDFEAHMGATLLAAIGGSATVACSIWV